jgi:uncharacterized protein YfaS (alpha-2-macroglobulin family)
VVDESVLALAGNPRKDPFSFFYALRRYLGTQSYISVVNLVEKLEIKDTSQGQKGGSGEGAKGGPTNKKRGIFKDTAFWRVGFITDAKGVAVVETDRLPDNLTTWVAEAVVATADTKIGSAVTTVESRLPLSILANTPRFVRPGDTIIITPQIRNGTDKAIAVTLVASSSGASIGGASTVSLTIPTGENKTTPIAISIPADTNRTSITLTLKATQANVASPLSDELTINLPVLSGDIIETRVNLQAIPAGASIDQTLLSPTGE